MDSLRSLPVYVLIPVLVLLGVTVVYVVLRALREGREVSFWPPRIGPRQSSESGDGKDQKSHSASPAWNEDPFSAAMASPGTLVRGVSQTAKFPDNALAFLYVESGSIAGVTFVLTTSAQSYLFGSIPSCDFVLPAVSRAQFRIHIRRQAVPTSSLRPYNLELQGMGSRIDLWVDGVSAEFVPAPLNDHSVIETGGLKIRVLRLP
jgi:hypothetical protein